jgi:hypothetical protein
VNVDAFAAKRSGQQDRAIERLHPLASRWLNDFGSDDALGDLVDAATDAWLDTFEAIAPQAYIDKAVGGFRTMIGKALAKTTEPESPAAASQIQRVATWLATVATNDATWQGFHASGGIRMRWVSRKDERTRLTHRAANGQIRSVLGAFDVGGAELRYPGDPKGPLEETMECRCVLAPAGSVRTRRTGMTAAAEGFDDRTSALVVLLPAEDDPANTASSEDIAHITFIWMGEPGADFDGEAIAAEVQAYAAETTPITVPVRERGVLGDEDADVLFLEPTDSLIALRDGLFDVAPTMRAAHEAAEQYPEWTPHVTLGYPETPALAEYDGDQITFDRFALWIGNERTEFPMGATAVTAAAIDLDVEDPETEIPADEDIADEDLVDDVLIEIPVHGVATIEGKPTGDGRMFAIGALTNRPLPLPIRYEFVGTHGGSTSDVAPVGRIDELWKVEKDGYVEQRFRGVIITTKPYANEAIEGIADGSLRGVSVETDDITVDVTEERENLRNRIIADRDASAGPEAEVGASIAAMTDAEVDELVDQMIGDGKQPITSFSSARTCGFTIVPIPAFYEGFIALGEAFEDEVSDEDREALAACGCYQPAEGDDESTIRGEDAFRDVPADERKKLAESGAAMPDGSFPIANVDDLKNAIQSIGRASDPAAAKAHIKKRARALGHPELIPEDWSLLQRYAAATDPEQRALIRRAISALSKSLDVPEELLTFAPGTKDGPGWVTHPRATARIRRYWVSGKGAAKIRWGAPGDFNRCRTQLAKYVQNPDWLAGLCANMHKEALGFWPVQHHAADGMIASAEARETHIDPFMRLVETEPVALIAGAAWPDTFPAEYFTDPHLTEETPITFDGDRVYGHVATWDSCHIGMPGICQNPPSSKTDYAYFRKGVIDTDEGPLRVGTLTFGTGHIGIRATAAQATAHYDKPQAVRAYVVIGEDATGIWFSGVLKPGLRKDDIKEFRALGAISGDWRPVKGNLELVAVTAVNANGFQLARKSALVAAANGVQTALITPPIVRHDPKPAEALVASGGRVPTPLEVASIARIAAQEVHHQQAIAPRVAAVRAVRGPELAPRNDRVRPHKEA